MAEKKIGQDMIKERMRKLFQTLAKNKPVKGVIRPYPEILNLYVEYIALEQGASPHKKLEKIQAELAQFCCMSKSCMQNYARLTRLIPELLENIGGTVYNNHFSIQAATILCSYPPESQLKILQEVLSVSELRKESFWLSLWKYNRKNKKLQKKMKTKSYGISVEPHPKNTLPRHSIVEKKDSITKNKITTEIEQDSQKITERGLVVKTLESLNVRAISKDWSRVRTFCIPQPPQWRGEKVLVIGSKY